MRNILSPLPLTRVTESPPRLTEMVWAPPRLLIQKAWGGGCPEIRLCIKVSGDVLLLLLLQEAPPENHGPGQRKSGQVV